MRYAPKLEERKKEQIKKRSLKTECADCGYNEEKTNKLVWLLIKCCSIREKVREVIFSCCYFSFIFPTDQKPNGHLR